MKETVTINSEPLDTEQLRKIDHFWSEVGLGGT